MEHLTLESPLGPLTVSAEGDAIVGLAIGIRHADSESTPLLGRAKTQLDEYFLGTRTTFDLPLHLSGTAFQEAIWTTLQTVPYGRTLSYQVLGEKAGRGTAPRAVGGAVGRNPTSHSWCRVIAFSPPLGGSPATAVVRGFPRKRNFSP